MVDDLDNRRAGTRMPYWRIPPEQILHDADGGFGITEIRQPAELARARQTGFVWSHRDGLVCLATNRNYLLQARDNKQVRVIIAPPEVAGDLTISGKCLVVCRQAEDLYLHLHTAQAPDDNGTALKVHGSAEIDESAVLRGDVSIGPGVRVGARAIISGPAVIGRDTCIDAGAIVGCEGLYAKRILGRRQHIPHFGGVEIGPSAFIHSGAVIVRSAIRGEATRIGASAHVGIMVNIGHDAEIGEAATLSSHCVIAGRARIGARVWVGASATVSNAICVGDDARVRLGAVVVRDVPAAGDVSGNFADNHIRQLRDYLKGAL